MIRGIYIILILSLIAGIPPARGDLIEASRGYLTELNFSTSSQLTDRWQGFYGTIQDGSFSSFNINVTGGNISRQNITSTNILFLLFSNSTLDSLSGFSPGNLSQIDAIMGKASDNATNTFLNQSSFNLDGSTIYSVPTTYTYVNGSQQFSSFREGFLTKGSTLVFIVQVSRSPGFNNVSYDYQAILPISESLKTYYVYVVTDPTPPPSSGGGGGGGSGEGTTGECFDNILSKETRDGFVGKDNIPISFKFVSPPVIFVNFTSTINAGDISVVVEVLGNSSCPVQALLPGIVYKNLKIWVGTSGFAVKEHISQASVLFEVNKSWILSNDIDSNLIKLVQYKGNWTSLATKMVGEDGKVIYYVANPEAFSPFAIVGEKKIAGPTPTEKPQTNIVDIIKEAVKPVVVMSITWLSTLRTTPGPKIVYLLFALLLLAYLFRRTRGAVYGLSK